MADTGCWATSCIRSVWVDSSQSVASHNFGDSVTSVTTSQCPPAGTPTVAGGAVATTPSFLVVRTLLFSPLRLRLHYSFSPDGLGSGADNGFRTSSSPASTPPPHTQAPKTHTAGIEGVWGKEPPEKKTAPRTVSCRKLLLRVVAEHRTCGPESIPTPINCPNFGASQK